MELVEYKIYWHSNIFADETLLSAETNSFKNI